MITEVTEEEKKVIEKLKEAMPTMSERDKGYLLGFAEGMTKRPKEGGDHEPVL